MNNCKQIYMFRFFFFFFAKNDYFCTVNQYSKCSAFQRIYNGENGKHWHRGTKQQQGKMLLICCFTSTVNI